MTMNQRMILNNDMLYIGHLRNMATEIFKALDGFTPIYIRDLFQKRIKFIIYV